jgi:putative ABC transport system substrate-binding protein
VGAMISAGVDPKETSAAPKSCSAASRRLIIANLLCCLCCLGQRMQSDYFTRRKFVTLLGGALVAWPLVARAQQTRIWRIGLLETSSASAARRLLWEALRQRLRELGYLEGQNIAFELRFGDRKSDRLSASAAELVGLQVDVIVTSGTPAALAAKQATCTIPIIMAQLADPVGAGLVSSLRRPGGNITGLTTQDPDLIGKRLQLLLEVIPRDSHVGHLVDETNPGTVLIARGTQIAAHSVGVQLQYMPVRDPSDLDHAFSAMKEAGAAALIVESSSMLFAWRTRLAELALKNRLPTVFAQREYADAGGLMSYAADFKDLFRRTATLVDKILKGAKPADLPVEQPTKFELVINNKTAKAIGLTIPESFLLRADEVIE